MRPTEEQKEIIAYNIHTLRNTKYPGWGGGRLCAIDFGVSTSHWSPWEVGSRTPDETSLQRIADFFGTTVDAIKSPPEGWETGKRADWRSKKRKRKNKGAEEPIEESRPPLPATDPEAIDEEAEDYLESVKMLAKIQSMRDRGILSPQAYQAKMKHIIGVIKFVMES